MSILEPARYITDGVMTATIDGPILHCPGIEQLSFQGKWTDVASPIGRIEVWGTNDPKAFQDSVRGLAQSAGAAEWQRCPIPDGGASVTGAGATVDANGIALDGTTAGTFQINVVDLYAYMRLRYVHTSGGGASDLFNATREGH